MKTATFKHTDNTINRSAYGIVTVQDDGKTSISIKHANDLPTRLKYAAQNKAKEIVAADFKHPDVISFSEDTSGIIPILKEYTAELKEEYIKRCEEFAEKDFYRKKSWLEQLPKDGSKAWFDLFGVETEMKRILSGIVLRDDQHVDDPNVELKRGMVYNRDNNLKWRKACDKIDAAKKLIHDGVEHAIKKANKNAINHYNSSLFKLASRIEKKGLNVNKMQVQKTGIGINIEIVLTDGDKTVKAWTILAIGDIVIPHYRYLVK